MNKRSKMVATIVGIICMLSCANKSESAEQLARPYEWTIQIETEKMPQHFQYSGSQLKDLVKAQMSYFAMATPDNKEAFQDLWYAKSKTIGLEKRHKLDIQQGDAVAIKLLHKTGSASEDEQHAGGKAVMKAILAAALNKNMVATIKVPMGSFYTIASEIQSYNFQPVSENQADVPISSNYNLFLESEPAGLTKAFSHMQ